ncbi:GDSL-type esterase/lipase family protein [Bacillus sp. NEB1478]|uniref:GDSL-type esterase/lipase family protein n=1 Tax=Bacillus sp. NEB1478 TaxID=3073816 RepID=UPI002872B6DB|nr:GDSL-type esterase/lipase family protein [Bacillus sp. NEB1478]WNB93841.1 GDSL-type esterase/lipase family protein [Bacillus sp. NEB1478]
MKKGLVVILVCLCIVLLGVFAFAKTLNIPSAFATVVDIGWSKIKSMNEKDVEVAALGDSLAYGLGDEEDHGYIGDVKYRYESSTNKTMVVKDYGVPNATSTDLLQKLNNEQIRSSAKSSDIIFVNIGTNDFLETTNHLTNFNEKELRVNQQVYMKNLNNILNILQNQENPKTIYILGIYNPKVKWADMDTINKTVNDWNQSTIQVTKSHKNTAYIRTDDIFIQRDKQKYFSDKLHPNKKGYALIGKRVFNTVKQKSK